MFININHLNEGSSVKGAGKEQNKLLNEGENPKTDILKEMGSNWHVARTQAHVNHNWEKLRK